MPSPQFQPALTRAYSGDARDPLERDPHCRRLAVMQLIRSAILLLLTFSAGASAFAQSLKRPWLGVVVGVPLTGDFQSSSPQILPYTGQVKRSFDFPFVAGITVEAPIGEHLSIEVAGLYRRLRYQNDPSVVVTWQVPVLAKYTLSSRTVSPFLEGGPSFRVAGNLNSTNPSHYGITVGAGADVRLTRFKIAPAVRYTHWAADGQPRTSPPTLTRQNQVELLVGLSF